MYSKSSSIHNLCARTLRITQLLLVIVLAVSYAQAQTSAARPSILIRYVDEALDEEGLKFVASRSAAISAFVVHLNSTALIDSVVTIQLGPSVELSIRRTSYEIRSTDNFSWRGRSADGLSQVAIAVLKGDIQGMIHHNAAVYRIESSGNQYIVMRIDQHLFPPELCPPFGVNTPEEKNLKNYSSVLSPEVSSLAGQPGKKGNILKGQEPGNFQCKLRILVMYTSSALAKFNDMHAMQNHIQTACDGLKQSFDNRGVDFDVELVHTVETAYTNGTGIQGYETDVVNFYVDGDGFMDNVHDLREEYSADVCVLIVDNPTACGIAAAIKSCENATFCLVHWSCAVTNYSFAHEIGHLIGARHNEQEDPKTEPFAYGHGYRYDAGSWRTIMSVYNWRTRIPYWSNPNVMYNGIAMGTTTTNDNARVLRENIENVMSHRPSSGLRSVTQADISKNNGVVYNRNAIETDGGVIVSDVKYWEFIAGNVVELLPGFESVLGAEFVARISSGCGERDNQTCNYDLAEDEALEPSSDDRISVFPNPSVDDVTIFVRSSVQCLYSFQLIDLLGVVVLSGDLDRMTDGYGTSLSLGSVATGPYLLCLICDNKRLTTTKVIRL